MCRHSPAHRLYGIVGDTVTKKVQMYQNLNTTAVATFNNMDSTSLSIDYSMGIGYAIAQPGWMFYGSIGEIVLFPYALTTATSPSLLSVSAAPMPLVGFRARSTYLCTKWGIA